MKILLSLTFFCLTKKKFIFLISLNSCVFLFSQNIIHGVVYDSFLNQYIPNASVIVDNEVFLTNNEGQFVIKSLDKINFIIVRALGYKLDTFLISKNSDSIYCYLHKKSNFVKPVNISFKESNQRFIDFFDFYTKSKTIFSYSKEAKCFFRTYTMINKEKPAEYFEAYYNVNIDDNGVKNPRLKAGRFLLSKELTFINSNPMGMIELLNPFNSEINNIYPYTPFIFNNWEDLKKYYKIVVDSQIIIEGIDTILHTKFIARNSKNGFSGDIYYHTKSFKIEKLKLYADSVNYIPFTSLKDSNNKISNLKYEIEIGFDFYKSLKIKSMNFNFEYDIQTNEKIHKINSYMNLYLYDYGNHFQLPICKSKIILSDYQKVAFYPYNSYFYDRNPFIPQNQNEKEIISKFESIASFDSKIKNYDTIPFMKNHVISWNKNWNPNYLFISKKSIIDAHYRLKFYNNEMKKKEWDSSFIFTFLFLDYDCYDDTCVYKTEALLDYKLSYVLNNDPIIKDYVKMYFDITKIEARKLLYGLHQKFKNKDCRNEKKITNFFNKINLGFEEFIYSLYSNSNSKYKLTLRYKVL